MWNDSIVECLQPTDLVLWGENQKESVIKTGEFLDTYGTIDYKSTQMALVARAFQRNMVKNGDIFYVPDIFYPSLEAIRYMAELSGIGVRIAAFNHAGRADENDFVQHLDSWSDMQEQVWHSICDLVFVGSDYHRKRVEEKFHPLRINVCGAVWSKKWMDDFCKGIERKKQHYIIWPHRPCREKQFDMFLRIAKANPRLHFVITSSGSNRLQNIELPVNVEYRYGLTKREYYEVFAHAEGYLSTALQETFGYTLQEAIYFGCKVVVPDYACYREYADRHSIMPFEDMCKENYLTEAFEFDRLTLSEQMPDNASAIVETLRNLQ